MKKIFLLAAFIFVSQFAFSQSAVTDKKDTKGEDWSIAVPDSKIKDAAYSKLIIQDLRFDKEDMGFVQKGAFNRIAAIVPVVPLETQFQNTFNQLVEPSADAGEMILQIKDFNFSELTAGYSETGTFIFRGIIFGGKDGKYQVLKMFDNKVFVSNLDVTKKLKEDAAYDVLDVLRSAILIKPATDKFYTMDEVNNFENIAKQSIPVFTTDSYKEGIYKNYISFSEQLPDFQISEVKDVSQGVYKFFYLDENGKRKNARGNYAIVYKGSPLINNGEQFVQLTKADNNLYFYGFMPKKVSTGKAVGTAVATAIGTAILTGGLFSVSMFPTADYVRYKFKIDFQNGNLIPLEEAPLPKK